MVDYREVTSPEWLARIAEFDRGLDPVWVCDQSAMDAGASPGPRDQALAIYLRRQRSTVAVALVGGEIVGYIVGDDDRDGSRGGCRGRYMGVTDTAVMQGLFDLLADRYGWIWGRITNPTIAAELATFGCEPMGDNVYSYRRS